MSSIASALSQFRISEDDTSNKPRIDIENADLWDSDEIAVLREVFKAAKSQNNHLKSVLKTNREQLRKLDRKYKRQE